MNFTLLTLPGYLYCAGVTTNMKVFVFESHFLFIPVSLIYHILFHKFPVYILHKLKEAISHGVCQNNLRFRDK